MKRSDKSGDFHMWEGEPQGCLFMEKNNELSWLLPTDSQSKKDFEEVG